MRDAKSCIFILHLLDTLRLFVTSDYEGTFAQAECGLNIMLMKYIIPIITLLACQNNRLQNFAPNCL